MNMNMPPVFSVMAKPAGPACNLECRYCFYTEKDVLYGSRHSYVMQDDVLESFIRQKIEAHKTNEVNFAWQGGEPALVGVEFFEKVVSLQQKYARGKTITNAFQTNGVLLNDQWCRFFAGNHFLVGISIDGPAALHNIYRMNKGGQPSFEQVMRVIDLLKKYNVEFNTLTVVHRENSTRPLEVYHFLKEAGSGFMQFIPVVERAAKYPGHDGLSLVSPGFEGESEVTPWSVEALQYGTFLCSVFDEWVQNDVGKVFVQIFDVALELWLGMPSPLCVFGKTCGQATVIEHNGDIYSCDHFVYPENKLGNILQDSLAGMLASGQQQKFGNDKFDRLPGYCRKCPVLFACNGECPKHRFLTTPDGDPGWNYLCRGYQKFFSHINPYMEFMANELRMGRAPANIMNRLRNRTGPVPYPGTQRNDTCPCGSGLKYKNCCGRNR